jgi:hypothetical protein
MPSSTDAPYLLGQTPAKGAEGIAVNVPMLAILTAARSVEVIGATWDEIDLIPRAQGPTLSSAPRPVSPHWFARRRQQQAPTIPPSPC